MAIHRAGVIVFAILTSYSNGTQSNNGIVTFYEFCLVHDEWNSHAANARRCHYNKRMDIYLIDDFCIKFCELFFISIQTHSSTEMRSFNWCVIHVVRKSNRKLCKLIAINLQTVSTMIVNFEHNVAVEKADVWKLRRKKYKSLPAFIHVEHNSTWVEINAEYFRSCHVLTFNWTPDLFPKWYQKLRYSSANS